MRFLRFTVLCALLLFAGAVSSYAFVLQSVTAFSQIQDETPSDAAVVLGAAVWNGRPSPVLRERANHAIDLYQRKIVKKILFTGGRGSGELLSEGESAAKYARLNGVPSKDILVESDSDTTYENLRNAKIILDENNLKTTLLVSDPPHMKRAMAMAEDLGFTAHSSPTPTSRFQTEERTADFLRSETNHLIRYWLGFGREK